MDFCFGNWSSWLSALKQLQERADDSAWHTPGPAGGLWPSRGPKGLAPVCRSVTTGGVVVPGLLPRSHTVSTDVPPACLQPGRLWPCNGSLTRGTLAAYGAKAAQADLVAAWSSSFLDARLLLRTFHSQAVERHLSLTSTPAPPPP